MVLSHELLCLSSIQNLAVYKELSLVTENARTQKKIISPFLMVGIKFSFAFHHVSRSVSVLAVVVVLNILVSKSSLNCSCYRLRRSKSSSIVQRSSCSEHVGSNLSFSSTGSFIYMCISRLYVLSSFRVRKSTGCA